MQSVVMVREAVCVLGPDVVERGVLSVWWGAGFGDIGGGLRLQFAEGCMN